MNTRLTLMIVGVLLGAQLSGCAYYNTFFHAEEFYDQAIAQQKQKEKQARSGGLQNQNRTRQNKSQELFSKCIRKCEKLAERFPGSKWRDDASLLMGKAYYGKKDYLAAKNELLRFISRYPESELLPSVYYYLGLSYYRSGNNEGARSAWMTLGESFPDARENKDVSYYLAQSYEAEDEIEKAEEAYEMYVSSHGRDNEAFNARLDRAAMWLEAGETEKAREELLIVREKGRNKRQRLDANMLLAETAEAEDKLEESLELYWDLAYGLDSNYMLGRISSEERKFKEEELVNKAQDEGVSVNLLRDKDTSRKSLDRNSWEYERLARVLLSEGEILAKMGRVDEAILAFEQVMAEYPKTAYAAEAQYRIGYSYEVYTEDLEEAERAYKMVSTHGRSSFSDDAIRRAGKLNQVKKLASAPEDSTSKLTADLAKARFLKAELFLFQQERPQKAIEEYESIQRDFAGTDYEGKAALAEAYVRFYVQEDQARGRAALGDVMRRFGDTEYGVYARRILIGPDPEPKLVDFAGPDLDLLLTDENLRQLALRDSVLMAAAGDPRPKDDTDFSSEGLFRNSNKENGADVTGGGGREALGRILNLDAVPKGGSSPILNAWEREPRNARKRLKQGFPYSPGKKKGKVKSVPLDPVKDESHEP